MTEFERALCAQLAAIASAIENVSTSLDNIEAEFGRKTFVDENVAHALDLVARSIRGRE